jgi:small conductance mechanosensitive channel
MSSLARDFFIKMTGRLIVLVGVIIAIAQLGVEVAPLLAGLGIAGFVIGFALQDTLSNFASGLMILVYRPVDVGDVVEAGGVTGTVSEMNLVSTMVLTFDNQLLIR